MSIFIMSCIEASGFLAIVKLSGIYDFYWSIVFVPLILAVTVIVVATILVIVTTTSGINSAEICKKEHADFMEKLCSLPYYSTRSTK